MSALAKYLYGRGLAVSGSDIAVNEEITQLEELGIPVTIGHSTDRVTGARAVVYTDAISQNDPELKRAKLLDIPVFSRMELLNEITREFSFIIAVAGSHGKTSTTSMCAHILAKSNKPFAAHIGGRDAVFDNFYANGNRFFLTEACEYKKNILRLSGVNTAVWLNCDNDHMECYKNSEDLRNTFYEFALRAERSVVNGEDKNIRIPPNAVRFAINAPDCDYTAVSLRQSGERYAFTVMERGEKLCRVKLRVAGRFHVNNALAAVAAMRLNGLEAEEIRAGLESFEGVKRRFEKIGTYRKAEFICDYAHHPAEIKKVLELANKRKRRNVYVIFQPHTYSRTEFLMREFAEVLSAVDRPVIYKTYAAREAYSEAGNAFTLHKNIKNSLYAESVRELEVFIKRNVSAGDTVLFLGAGDIYYLAVRLLLKLGGKENG